MCKHSENDIVAYRVALMAAKWESNNKKSWILHEQSLCGACRAPHKTAHQRGCMARSHTMVCESVPCQQATPTGRGINTLALFPSRFTNHLPVFHNTIVCELYPLEVGRLTAKAPPELYEYFQMGYLQMKTRHLAPDLRACNKQDEGKYWVWVCTLRFASHGVLLSTVPPSRELPDWHEPNLQQCWTLAMCDSHALRSGEFLCCNTPATPHSPNSWLSRPRAPQRTTLRRRCFWGSRSVGRTSTVTPAWGQG